MTHHVWIHPEHVLLWSVRYALTDFPDWKTGPRDAYLAAGSACILSLQGALEAIVNRLLEGQGRMRHWDELRLLSKIDTLVELSGSSIDWDKQPWQEIAHLVRLRNWLAHNKDPLIGLGGDRGVWIADGIKKRIPRVDPLKELREQSVRSLYAAVREAGYRLAELVGVADKYEYLKTERYEPVLVG